MNFEVVTKYGVIYAVAEHKKSRALRLKIYKDGRVRVTVPFGLPLKTAQSFAAEKAEWIFKHLEKFRRIEIAESEAADRIEDGGQAYLLGKKFSVKFELGASAKTFIEVVENENFDKSANMQTDGSRGIVIIRAKADADQKKIQTAYKKWTKKLALEVFDSAINSFMHIFENYDVGKPQIAVREMRARWGSCNVRSAEITFSLKLIRVPYKAVEYVVLHEMTHLLYYAHDDAFYNFIAQYMPDWKMRKKLLNAPDLS